MYFVKCSATPASVSPHLLLQNSYLVFFFSHNLRLYLHVLLFLKYKSGTWKLWVGEHFGRAGGGDERALIGNILCACTCSRCQGFQVGLWNASLRWMLLEDLPCLVSFWKSCPETFSLSNTCLEISVNSTFFFFLSMLLWLCSAWRFLCQRYPAVLLELSLS